MPRKVILDEKEVISLYKTEYQSTHKLAEHLGVGHKRISKILKENDVEIRKKGAQKRIIKNFTFNEVIDSYTGSTSTKYICICKKTNKEFDDVINSSGALTKHMKITWPEITIPSSYKRKTYAEVNGKLWYDQFFNIKEVILKPTRKCKLCNWETTDIGNKTGCFENHVKDDHNMSIGEYLGQFPKDIKYHPTYVKRKERDLFLEKDENHVVCQECGEKFKQITRTHLKSVHNITLREYIERHGKIMSDSLHETYSKHLDYLNKNVIKKTYTSKAEINIYNLIKELGFTPEQKNKTLIGQEIDIIIPSLKLGIEYNGNYYHTEKFKPGKNFHLNKTKQMNEIGYSLIHIFEDEWELNKDLVTNKLKHILGVKTDKKTIGARNCTIKEIYKHDKDIFLNQYHIQGKDTSTIKLGAYYNEGLLAVMTFRVHKSGGDTYELTRFATKYDYILPGMGSKLLKHFIRNYFPTMISSFADRRWTLDKDDNLYTKLGFNLKSTTYPDYRYYHPSKHGHERLHKFGFRKQTLHKKYNLPLTMTESEMTKELGYEKIWDCGLFKYELHL